MKRREVRKEGGGEEEKDEIDGRRRGRETTPDRSPSVAKACMEIKRGPVTRDPVRRSLVTRAASRLRVAKVPHGSALKLYILHGTELLNIPWDSRSSLSCSRLTTMSAASKRNTILRLIRASQHTACPCHGCRTTGAHGHGGLVHQLRRMATPVDVVQKEYAFEVMWSSNGEAGP